MVVNANDEFAVMLRDAQHAVRDVARAKLHLVLLASPEAFSHEVLDDLAEAVIDTLADGKIAWALAYLAGVRMAADILRGQHPAQHRPPLPPCGGG